MKEQERMQLRHGLKIIVEERAVGASLVRGLVRINAQMSSEVGRMHVMGSFV
jgi:hypothetical protein